MTSWERLVNDAYFTHPDCTRALLTAVSFRGPVFEPACGRGDMARVLIDSGYRVRCADLHRYEIDLPVVFGLDFLRAGRPSGVLAIASNPPYSDAEKFVRHAIELMRPVGGQVAMLLRDEFFSAWGRADLFDRPPFAAKLNLRFRPYWDWWLPPDPSRRRYSPRVPYAWGFWDWRWRGRPIWDFVPDPRQGPLHLRPS